MPRVAPLVGVLALVCFFALLVVIGQAQTASPYPPARPQRLATGQTSTARGEQLVMLGGCNDCHTPKLPGGRFNVSRLLSGQPLGGPVPPDAPGAVTTNMHLTAWRGPWGVSLARNITPDNETGIGTWSLADFKRTIRTGVDPKGQVLNPPMPIPTLQNLPDEDLEAIYNYLRTVKPIRNDTSGKAASAPAKTPR
jgi:mono/diheme cytochrome c family protein